MFKSPMFQLIELVIPASVAGALLQTAFQNQPQLQSISGDKQVYIKALEVYNSTSLLSSPLTANSANANSMDIANAVITLSVNGTLNFKSLPLSRLNLLQDNTGGDPNTDGSIFQLRDVFKIDWTQSYITTILNPAGGGGLTAPPFSYLIGVHYGYAPDADDIFNQETVRAAARKAGQPDPKNWQ